MALWTLIQSIAIYPVQSAIFDALQILNSKAWGTKQKKFHPSEVMWLFIVSFPQAFDIYDFSISWYEIHFTCKQNFVNCIFQWTVSCLENVSCMQIQPCLFVASGAVLIAQMTEIIKGQKTKVFQSYPVPQREVCKFPLTLNSWLTLICMCDLSRENVH